MMLLRSFVIAFSMWSAIPMPQVEWDRDGMKYALCAFPFIGLAAGGAVWLWLFLCGGLGLTRLLAAAGAALLPVAVSGGIHLDGFCDASDAIASRQGPEKKLEIMKDPRAGAFGVMAVCGYLLLSCALWDTLLAGKDPRVIGAVCLGFLLSRALSGFAVAVFPLAKESGLAHTFATGAEKRVVAILDGHLAFFAAAGMVALAPLPGLAAAAGAALAFLWYLLVCRGFGGTTGDLAGWFLTVCEGAILAGAVVGQAIM